MDRADGQMSRRHFFEQTGGSAFAASWAGESGTTVGFTVPVPPPAAGVDGTDAQ